MLINDGVYKMYLDNGKIITLVSSGVREINNELHDVTTIMGTNVSRTWFVNLPTAKRYLIQAWSLVGVSITKHVAGTFPKHTWKDQRWKNVSCRLVMYREKVVDYNGTDVEFVNEWYVRLNRPIEEIEGAVGQWGIITEEFRSFICNGLWDEGLQETTAPSAYSPTGQMRVGTFICAGSNSISHMNNPPRGRRVIVSNIISRDV